MALLKDKTVKGLTADYWKIVDCDVKNGKVMLALYANKESAKSRDNMLEGRVGFDINFPIDVTNPLSYAYTKIVESKIVDEVETNWYADAVSDEV